MIKIACFGEAMRERSVTGPLAFGGDTYNTAVYLKRLLQTNADVYFVSAIGSDELSESAYSLWQQQGLNSQFLIRSTNRSLGCYNIETDTSGERVFHYERNNSAVRQYFYLDIQQNFIHALKQAEFSHVYFSAISIAILDEPSRALLFSALHAFSQAGGQIIFDSNYRKVLWQSVEVAARCYHQAFQIADMIFVTNDDHFGVLGDCKPEELVTFYRQFANKLIVLKQGVDDTLVLTKDRLMRYPVTLAKHVVDTTAAGDAFAAGFLAQYLRTPNIDKAVTTAQTLAAQVIAASGAIVTTNVQVDVYEKE
ncbi:sugar kinase [Paraglaciecola sp.]|uniref:sugar kinase n=1 Tax=Paraglaciecola sp. TaxID=1920173 RepID=UPI0030F4462C